MQLLFETFRNYIYNIWFNPFGLWVAHYPPVRFTYGYYYSAHSGNNIDK